MRLPAPYERQILAMALTRQRLAVYGRSSCHDPECHRPRLRDNKWCATHWKRIVRARQKARQL